MAATKTRTFKGEWMGGKGTQITHYFQSRETGQRVIVHTWAATPHKVEVRAVKGDFWRKPDTAMEYERVNLTKPSARQLAATVARLAKKHFAKEAK
jgi:hypothetical protein